MPIDTKYADVDELVDDLIEDNPSEVFWLERLLDNDLDGIEALKAQMEGMRGTPGWATFVQVLQDYDRQIVTSIVDQNEDDEFTRGIAKGIRLALAFTGAVEIAHSHITQSAGADEETSAS